jgi:two-component system chemotaxis response regulator CheY
MPFPDSAKILVVDDLTSMRTALRQALARLGFSDVMECADGAEALTALRGNDISLVISDWQMEPMDGLLLLEAMRADDTLKQLPFILMSGETEPDLERRATAAGAQWVLSKPFGADALRRALDGLGSGGLESGGLGSAA